MPYTPSYPARSPRPSKPRRCLAHAPGKPFHRVEGLHEHERGDVGYFHNVEDFYKAVRSLIESPKKPVFGIETADEAHLRFSGAMDDVMGGLEVANLAVLAMALSSLYVARKSGADPNALWKRLKLPSYVVINLPEHRLIEVVDNGLETP